MRCGEKAWQIDYEDAAGAWDIADLQQPAARFDTTATDIEAQS